jgi:exopolysaccharide biosynthesis protein
MQVRKPLQYFSIVESKTEQREVMLGAWLIAGSLFMALLALVTATKFGSFLGTRQNETVLLLLVCGAMGLSGALVHLYRRRRSRRE